MAVYTDISDEDLRNFLEEYDIGTPIAVKGIAEGVENSNFYLETDQGRYILTLFEKRAKPEDLPYFVAIMDHLSARGFPAPNPIKARDGQALRRLKSKPALIVSFLQGMSPTKPSPEQCRQIGGAAARMHETLSDFQMVRPNDLSLSGWNSLFAGRENDAEALTPHLGEQIRQDLEALNGAWPSDSKMPTGVIHADLFCDNAFFLGEDFSGVIDFYFSCNDFLAYELAVLLNAWAFEARGEFNITKGNAIIRGYESVRPLTHEERDALPLLARGAAMRFFLTRLVDWHSTPADALVQPKNPLEYAEKLNFHRTATTIADYGG